MPIFKTALILPLLILSIWFSAAYADSWCPPTTFEVSSQNKKIVVVVTPGTEKQSTRLDVFSVEKGKRKLLWSANAPEQETPLGVEVPNDGKHIITFDNIGHAGYGDYVVVIYSPKGLIKHYSLEEMFPPKPSEQKVIKDLDEIDRLSRMHNPKKEDRQKLATLLETYNHKDICIDIGEEFYFENKFSHSTSSRWWRENSVGFFNDRETSYGLWVPWDNRWLVWNLDTGQRVSLTAEQIQEWNSRTREIILTRIKNKEVNKADYKFLGKLKCAEDKPLIMKLLDNPNFHTTSEHSYASGDTKPKFTYLAQSDYRLMADQILAHWETGEPVNPMDKDREPNHYLGAVNFTITYQAVPRKQDGFLSIFLVPLNSQSEAQPIQKLIVDLSNNYPREYFCRKKSGLTEQVNFAIRDTTPGSYKVKVLWDKVAPFDTDKNHVFRPSPGDYISSNEPIVTISPGKTIEGISINCKELVK